MGKESSSGEKASNKRMFPGPFGEVSLIGIARSGEGLVYAIEVKWVENLYIYSDTLML